MYSQIVNPLTKKKVSVNSLLGNKILKSYLINLRGNDSFVIKKGKKRDTTQNIKLIIREKRKT